MIYSTVTTYKLRNYKSMIIPLFLQIYSLHSPFFTSLHFQTLYHHATDPFTTLHFISHHFTSQRVASHYFAALQFTSHHITSLRFASVHITSLHFPSRHFTSLHFMPYLSHLPSLDHSSTILQDVQEMMFLIMIFYPVSCCYLPLRPKYFPQHPVLGHPHSTA